jgi:peptidoglycan-associated lipoprotein
MKTHTIIVLILPVLLTLGACRTPSPKQPTAVKPGPATAPERPDDGSARVGLADEKTEPAQGEVREALLSLRRVHFSYNTDRLLPAARKALDEAAARLKAAGDLVIHVEGHADLRGSPEHNLALGERRAQAVRAYLARAGIPEERLNVASRGKESPLAEGTSVKDHALNRRVEFRVMRGDVRLVVEDGTLFDDLGRPLPAPRQAAHPGPEAPAVTPISSR